VDLIIYPSGNAILGDRRMSCALGRTGITAAKREGDGATPAGLYPLREVFYRPDRIAALETDLPCTPLSPDFGWCDDATDAAYNQQVRLPYAGGHENLWREDALYDLIAVIGYNDAPAIPEKGSAIFMHIALTLEGKSGFHPTEGCIALSESDLRYLVTGWGGHDRVDIRSHS
jgi:L,D-peptidoglycan transpeptidase YkuD (ErfK/YbiS/YcfS/YnhG family)